MRFANKMMLVPAVRNEPELEKMSALDQEMAKILKNRSLSTLEKMKKYHQVLQQNLAVEARLKQKGVPRDDDMYITKDFVHSTPLKKENVDVDADDELNDDINEQETGEEQMEISDIKPFAVNWSSRVKKSFTNLFDAMKKSPTPQQSLINSSEKKPKKPKQKQARKSWTGYHPYNTRQTNSSK